MEPITTYKGFKTLQDPRKAAKVVANYYKDQGFNVSKQPKVSQDQRLGEKNKNRPAFSFREKE